MLGKRWIAGSLREGTERGSRACGVGLALGSGGGSSPVLARVRVPLLGGGRVWPDRRAHIDGVRGACLGVAVGLSLGHQLPSECRRSLCSKRLDNPSDIKNRGEKISKT